MRYRARPVSYFDNEILELERVFAAVFLLASPLTGIEAPPPLLELTSFHSARPCRVELDIDSLPVSSLFENHERLSKTILDAFWSSRDSLSRVALPRHRLDMTVKGATRHCESLLFSSHASSIYRVVCDHFNRSAAGCCAHRDGRAHHARLGWLAACTSAPRCTRHIHR